MVRREIMLFSCKIAAQAGAGVMVTGRSMAKCFTRGGYNVVAYSEYPSLVRGGHNVVEVLVSDNEVRSPRKDADVVIALNRDAVFYHKDFIGKGGAIIYDESLDMSAFKVPKHVTMHPVPLAKLIAQAGGTDKMRNTVALACALALVKYPFNVLEGVISDEFGRKGAEVVKQNVAAAKAGYDYMSGRKHGFPISFGVRSEKRKVLIAGNEAMALGAVKGGMKFFSAYPMTPASTILHYLVANERKFNIVVKQTEDEIAAMNYITGASFAGVRSMTGTSGGGFALMVEALGLAALAEAPVVVALVQRPGPSTGMPTWTEQADLRFALHASQGDFLRVIMAPGDVAECFSLSAGAFNIAEKYQLPVILLSDKFLGETFFSTERFDDSKLKIERGKVVSSLPPLPPNTRFKRYELTKDGVSPRVFPGTPNGMHVATSYEHDESGFSSESFVMRAKQVDKRAAKLKGLLKDLPAPKLYGPKAADVTLVCWGSQKLPALDALNLLQANGVKANVLHFSCVFPLDEAKVMKALGGKGKKVMLENNPTGQFAGVLKQYCGWEPDFLLLKYDGRQWFAEQIAEEVGKLASGGFKGAKEVRVHEKDDMEYYNPQRHGLL